MRLLTTPILCLLFLFCASLKGDDKLLKQVTAQVNKANYEAAAAGLQQVSETGKTSVEYLQLASLVYDSLKDYKKAIASYEQLLQEKSNNGIVERIGFLRNKLAASDESERVLLEKIKNCKKCSGTGYYSTQVICPKCLGGGRIVKDCSRCQGTGKMACSNCRGTGKMEVYVNGKLEATTCNRCYGTGGAECTNMCNHGKITEDCGRCSAQGVITKSIKCDQHP